MVRHQFHPEGSSAVAWSTWWEISSTHTKKKSGASRLLDRCLREYDWSFDYGKAVLHGYKDFLYVCSFLPSENWLIPSISIHKMWQQHIFDTRNYANDCQVLLGQFLYYNLYDADSEDEQKQRETVKFIKEKTNQKHLDEVVWGYDSNLSHLSSISNNTPLKQPCSTPLKRSASRIGGVTPFRMNRIDSNNPRSLKSPIRERPFKKPRASLLGDRKHPWDTNQAPIAIQINYLPGKKNCFELRKNNENDENTVKTKIFQLERHIPLNRVFLEFASLQNIERKCLSFQMGTDSSDKTNNTSLKLGGTETLHSLSKDLATSMKNSTIVIHCKHSLLEC
jgi:hypothetical protein